MFSAKIKLNIMAKALKLLFKPSVIHIYVVIAHTVAECELGIPPLPNKMSIKFFSLIVFVII